MAAPQTASYWTGPADHERRRLALQAKILEPYSERFLRDAGLGEGMRVLDFGCGVGDLTLLAARLVGERGMVTGVDVDDRALGCARQRAQDAGVHHVSFLRADLAHLEWEEPVDAVIGRHVLIHTKNPVEVLAAARALLRLGGLLAFEEYDLSHPMVTAPPMPVAARCLEAIVELFLRVSPHANAGPMLHRWFREAGFALPRLRAEAVMDGGEESLFPTWIAETMRSHLPKMEALGIVREGELSVDSLEGEMREEVRAIDGCWMLGPLVGCFSRKF